MSAPATATPKGGAPAADDELFRVVDEKDIPTVTRAGKWDIEGIWAAMQKDKDGKSNVGKYLTIDGHILKKKFYRGEGEPKHLWTNIQKRLSDFLGEKVVVRKVQGCMKVYVKVPKTLPAKK